MTARSDRDAATRLMPPLDDEGAAEPAAPFDPQGATTVQEISVDFDELPDAPPISADVPSDALHDPFGSQETQVDYRSYASDEATGAFEISVALPSFDEDDVTDTRLSPPPVFSDVPNADERPATGFLLVDGSSEGAPPLPPPRPAAPDAPTLQLAPLPDDSAPSAEAPRPPARAVPLPPTPSRFHAPVPTQATHLDADVTDPSSASGRPVELERWRVVPTVFAKPDVAPEGTPQDAPLSPSSLPDLSAAQTVLWSLEDELEETPAPPPAEQTPRARTVVWHPDDDDEAPTGAEPASLLEPLTQPASREGAPSSAAARAASTYISDGLAYLRSLHAFAAHLDEDAQREFMSRALGAAEKLRRALALLSAAPLDDESQDEP